MHQSYQPVELAYCLQTERDGLSKKLAATSKQLAEANSKAACASLEAQNVNKEQRRLQAEVERLSSVVHSHSIRLQKCVRGAVDSNCPWLRVYAFWRLAAISRARQQQCLPWPLVLDSSCTYNTKRCWLPSQLHYNHSSHTVKSS
jgi:hypothetical protein